MLGVYFLLISEHNQWKEPVAVAFFLSVKQKVLGYTQLQKGPNTIGPYGLLQLVADCLKLFIKDIKSFIKVYPSTSSWWFFI